MLVPTFIPPHQAGKGCGAAPGPRCWLHVPILVPRSSPSPRSSASTARALPAASLMPSPGLALVAAGSGWGETWAQGGGCHPAGVGMGRGAPAASPAPRWQDQGCAHVCVCLHVCVHTCVCLQRCLLHPGLAAQAVCTGVSSCRVAACLPAQVPGLCPLPCPSPGWVCTAGGAPLWGQSPPTNPASCPIARPAALGATPRRGVTADQRWGP